MDGKNDWRPGPTVCRCCLSEGCYKDISTEYFWMGKKEVYADMLLDTFELTIQYAQTGGPNSQSRLICEPCISRLRDAADFKRQVKECEQTFLHYLNPSTSINVEVPLEPLEKEPVKIETVKQETALSDDDDFGDNAEYVDDDDDLDDEPLMNLATKVPKKESVDVMDLIDNNAKAEKRKASTKSKASPAKKAKVKEAKPTASKPKPEKKKKDEPHVVKRNAGIILKHSTAYPFKVPKNNVMCIFCCNDFPASEEFRKHMEYGHASYDIAELLSHPVYKRYFVKVDCTDLRCKICNERFEKLINLAEHLNEAHDLNIELKSQLGLEPYRLERDKLLCGICDKNFPCLRQLNRHMTTHYKTFPCTQCDKTFTAQKILNNHITFSHASSERVCLSCKETFESMEARLEHLKNSEQCWLHKCRICNKRFRRGSWRDEHLVNDHGAEKKTHPCQECGLEFNRRSTYLNHFRTNHSEFHLVCSFCGKKFSRKYHLERHLHTHSDVRHFTCLVCSKAFRSKSNLDSHMKLHSEVKPYVCEICCQGFNSKIRYKNHMQKSHGIDN